MSIDSWNKWVTIELGNYFLNPGELWIQHLLCRNKDILRTHRMMTGAMVKETADSFILTFYFNVGKHVLFLLLCYAEVIYDYYDFICKLMVILSAG